MDGFAVKAESTVEAQPTNAKKLDLGDKNQSKLMQFMWTPEIPFLKDFNAVIPIENTEPLTANGETSTDIRKPQVYSNTVRSTTVE